MTGARFYFIHTWFPNPLAFRQLCNAPEFDAGHKVQLTAQEALKSVCKPLPRFLK